MLTGNIGKKGAGARPGPATTRRPSSRVQPGHGDPASRAGSPRTRSSPTSTPRPTARTSRCGLLQGRGAGLLEPRRRAADRRRRPSTAARSSPGKTHMPTPTKAIIFNNVNLFNNAKWAYDMFKNVNPKYRDDHLRQDIQMTAIGRVRRLRPARQQLGRVRGPRGHRVLLEPVPADLEGRHQARLRQQGRPGDPRRASPQAVAEEIGDDAVPRLLQVRAGGEAQRLHPAPAGHLHDHDRATSSTTSWREVRSAGRCA